MSGTKALLWNGAGSAGKWGGAEGGRSVSGEKSRSFCPLMLSRAGLMSGRRWRAELELDVTEPATEGVGEGPGDDGRLPDFREK